MNINSIIIQLIYNSFAYKKISHIKGDCLGFPNIKKTIKTHIKGDLNQFVNINNKVKIIGFINHYLKGLMLLISNIVLEYLNVSIKKQKFYKDLSISSLKGEHNNSLQNNKGGKKWK